MSANVIQLPRPVATRPELPRLGLYLYVGHNQHKEVLDLLAEGIHDFHGVVIDASCADRHKELISEAVKQKLDVVMDPKTQRMATIGGYSASLGELPWGLERPHRLEDFAVPVGRDRAERIAEFAVSHRFTQLFGPTHILRGPNDPWLRTDIRMMGHVRDALNEQKSGISLIYSLALPMEVFRDRLQRQAILAALSDAPYDALWLKIENFGSDATGEKAAAYIAACSDLQILGVPIVADQVGGLPGLGLLAFGATGGIAHGITMLEKFKPSPWRRARLSKQKGGVQVRVYLPGLDVLFKPEDAAAFLKSNSRVHSQFGCRDTHCCPKGVPDMLDHPSRHFVYQRIRQVRSLSASPKTTRIQNYLDNEVRRVSDDVAVVAGFKSLGDDIAKLLGDKQKKMGRFRRAISHLAEINPIHTPALVPLDRATREQNSNRLNL